MECLAEASVMAVDQGKEQGDDLVQPDSESYKSLLDEYTHLAPAEGEVLQGTVLKVNAKDVIVDFGYKSEGLVPIEQFLRPLPRDVTAAFGRVGSRRRKVLVAARLNDAVAQVARDQLMLPVREVLHRSEEHTSELQSLRHLVCRLLLEK